MIKHARVQGLNGKHDFEISFDRDLTILTGRNGSGKTALLKLIWCLISPNRGRILNEIQFKSASVETSRYRIEVSPNIEGNEAAPFIARYVYTPLPVDDNVEPKVFDVLYDEEGYVRDGSEKILSLNDLIEDCDERTIFFPTYRRIEGGFGAAMDIRKHRLYAARMHRYHSEIAEALESFSAATSFPGHTFVTSISTNDIENNLFKFNSRVNERVTELYLKFSKDVERIVANRSSALASTSPMEEISELLNKVSEERDALQKPWAELSKFVSSVFKDQGIRISDSLVLGDATKAVYSKFLSAGEKQLFSFLSYNAFLDDAVIFIDEPELSLHVDWQRRLFDMLLEQGSTNQFVATTHSPFIYSRYQDKEYFLDENRGWESTSLNI